MGPSGRGARRCAGTALLGAALFFGGVAGADLASPGEADVAVRVTGVVTDPDLVRGHVRNLTEGELRDVRLLVVHEFQWADEMHPGPVSPGRSETMVIDRIPPRESVAFHHVIAPPLSARDDGAFTTHVEVLGFTQIGP